MISIGLAAVILSLGSNVAATPVNNAGLELSERQSSEPTAFPHCPGPNSTDLCKISDVQTCISYLNKKGSAKCNVNGPPVVFCTAGNCQIGGQTDFGAKTASASCAEVAKGAQQVIDSCKFNSPVPGMISGAASAENHGYLLVTVHKK